MQKDTENEKEQEKHGRLRKLRRVLLGAAGVCYLLALLYATFGTRGAFYQGEMILKPFASYIEAWNKWSVSDWRNIGLNILLFVPFGFLLPLWSEKLHRGWLVILSGFACTLLIETVQFQTGRGIFETDDLIGNTFGVWIGYGVFRIVYSFFKEHRVTVRRVLWSIAPVIIFCFVSAGIFAAYSAKELGNLESCYSRRIDTKRVHFQAECGLSDKAGKAPVYRTVLASAEEREQFIRTFYEKIGVKTNIGRERQQYPGLTIMSGADEKTEYHLWVYARGLTYQFTDFSSVGEEFTEVENVDEKTVREALLPFGIEVPEKSVFEKQGRGYRFTVSMQPTGEKFIYGTLDCWYYSDGTVKEMRNNLVESEYYRDAELISEAEAYRMLEDGRVNMYVPKEGVYEITVKSVTLDYEVDSKGFCQPVYHFAVAGGEEQEGILTVPALK